MEHLPIVFFEIVLSVFIAFAVFARFLIKQITDYQKQIKKLEADLEIQINQYHELEKFVHSNTELVSCVAELEPMYYEKDPKEYLDSVCERMGYKLVHKMSETFNKRMLERIKELLMDSYLRSELLYPDIMSLKTRIKVSVPVFRVDYDYIKLSRAENIFR